MTECSYPMNPVFINPSYQCRITYAIFIGKELNRTCSIYIFLGYPSSKFGCVFLSWHEKYLQSNRFLYLICLL